MDELGEYKEYTLYSSGQVHPHHIMKVPHSKFNMESMIKPITLVRQPLPDRDDAKPLDDKIAPFGAKQRVAFKKKIKTFYLSRENEVEEGNDEELFVKDPDSQPYILSDSTGKTYIGNVESSQSNYVFLVLKDDSFNVIPASKTYKFMPKLNHRVLSIEEAEEALKSNKVGKMMGSGERWAMNDKKSAPMKSWKAKLLGLTEEPVFKSKKRVAEDAEEMDYDANEDFQDDDDIELGIEDKDEAKEANERVFGRDGKKASIEDDEDDQVVNPYSTKTGKKLAESLARTDHNDAYLDMEDEENPYLSDQEDESDNDLTISKAITKPIAKKKRLDSGGNSQAPSRQSSPPPDIKRKRVDNEPKVEKKQRQNSPAPPSAAQVVARLEKEQRDRERGRAPSASPPPMSPKSTPSSPLSIPILTEDDIIRAVAPENGIITVKEVVAKLAHFFKDPQNKERLKEFMRNVVDHDKATGKLTLRGGALSK